MKLHLKEKNTASSVQMKISDLCSKQIIRWIYISSHFSSVQQSSIATTRSAIFDDTEKRDSIFSLVRRMST